MIVYICKMDIGNRFMEVFAYSGLGRQAFADRLKISPAVLSHISSGRNQPSLDLIMSLLRAYPEISPDWLLLGSGKMKRGIPQHNEPLAAMLSASPAPTPEPLPPADERPVPYQEAPVVVPDERITDVNYRIPTAPDKVKALRENILAMRIALQMHQQWMEQQLAKLEKELESGVGN